MRRALILTGGTGGAKLAAGAQEELGPGLSLLVNTADDIEALGVHVSPDPDLCTYWLSGEIDPDRGWGIRDDSFRVFERLQQLGAPDWFGLSDLDLATCLERRRLLDSGLRQTEAQARIARALGVEASVLPMCDEPVRTRVRTEAGWRELQEYLVRDGSAPAIEEVRISGLERARPTPEAEAAIASAEAILIGPSNPVISIGPILAVPGMRDLLGAAGVPVVAVSPFVAGEVLKGPTDEFMRAAGREPSAAGVAAAYAGLIDGLIVDAGDPEPVPGGVEVAVVDTLMDGPDRRREVAAEALRFAASLR